MNPNNPDRLLLVMKTKVKVELLDPETGEVTLIQQTIDPDTSTEVKTDGTTDKKKSNSRRSRK